MHIKNYPNSRNIPFHRSRLRGGGGGINPIIGHELPFPRAVGIDGEQLPSEGILSQVNLGTDVDSTIFTEGR